MAFPLFFVGSDHGKFVSFVVSPLIATPPEPFCPA
jgi:hypothetical protein